MEGSSQGVLFAKKGGITYVYYPSLPWNGWVPIDPKKQTPAAKVSWSNQSPGIPTLMTETGQPSFGVSTGTGPANLPDATPCTTSTITNTTDKTGYLLGLGTILGSTMIKGNNTIKAVLQVAGGLQTAKSLVGNNTVNLTPCSQNLGTVTTPPQYQTSNGGISNAGLGAFANTNPAFANAANVLTSFGVHIPGLSP
jgi:hypothetical protein